MQKKVSEMQNDYKEVELARFAVKQELQKKQMLNQPIAKYDPKEKKIYLEKKDGSRELVGECMKEGRFSERRRKKT